MITIKTKLANGDIEVFKSNEYTISNSKNFHPMIISVTVYDNGKKIAYRKRPFAFFYKKFTFKSEKVQNELKKLSELNSQTIMENSVEVKNEG